MRKLLLFLVAIIAIFCFISCNQDVETKTYTVTFNANGADSGTAPSAIQVQEGKSFTIPSQGTLLKSGYDFVGWNTKSDGSGEVFAIFQSVNVTRDMKLFAVWKEHSDEPDISDDDSGVVYESLVFSYLSESDSYSVSVCRNKGITTIVIPSEHEGKPITEIGVRAFRDCTSLTMVTIPSSVILIEDYAFEDCENLSIVFAGGMESIPSGALSNASGVVSVSMPESVTSIGSNAFSGCSGLTSVTIPSNVTSIGGGAFRGCSGLTSMTIPEGVTSIGSSAFEDCENLSIVFAEGMESILSGALSNASGVVSVTIPESVTSIGEYAFYGCSGLTSVTIPEGVTSIGSSAFEDCENLSIMFAEGMESIPSRALSNASGVVSVTMPESVTSIGEYAFSGCSGLTDIVYLGTKTQWNSMQKGVSWDFSTGNYTVHCTDGDLAKN